MKFPMNPLLLLLLAGLLLLCLACNLPAPAPTPDLMATLAVSTPQVGAASSTPVPEDGEPHGHIVFTCQIFKVQAANQICIVNADGTGYRRLTTDDSRQHYYPSLAPDGLSLVYAAFREAGVYEIYEMTLADGSVCQLTDRLGVVNAPEISPDGTQIVFTHWIAAADRNEIWIMARDGSRPHRLADITGWDPTWSPDGTQILFASNRSGPNQLWVMDLDGSNLHQVSDLPALRGRSDWSAFGEIVTYSGEPWKRELFLMNADGSGLRQLTPAGGNSQVPSFSPDGRWVVFTAYFDHPNDDHGCELYLLRTDGTDLRRLTDNAYCDYQPRWGP
jgi:Tol biopolymer transport system component